MMKVYGDGISGNCYKIQLLLSHLGIPYQWLHTDVVAGDCQQTAFIKKNANAKVPLLELENGQVLAESNAILHYLAEGSAYLPVDPWEKAQVLQWQFFEQYSHEPFIAVARFINVYLGLPVDRMDDYHAKQPGGHKALQVMEQHLQQHSYFVAGYLSIADISLYAYTHVAHEGGFDLQPYPAVQAWLARVANHPKHIGMQDTSDSTLA